MERSALERRTEREKRILTNDSVMAEWCRMERTPGLRARRSAIKGRSNQRRFFRTQKRSFGWNFTFVADAQQGRAGVSEPINERMIDAQRLRMGAATVVMMVIQRTVFPVMLMTSGRGRTVMIVAAGRGLRAARSPIGIKREDADIQPGQHAKNHQPCEKRPHQRSGPL